MDFMVLPDHPAGTAVAALLSGPEQVTIVPHHSGRPWIVGRWSDEDFVAASVGENKVAILGCTTVNAVALTAQFRSVRTSRDLDALAWTLPGCFHLISSIDGRVRAQGSLSTGRQIFYGSVAGVTVAADRPQALAALTGSGVDEGLMALQLLSPFGAPWPLSGKCLWRGVESLPLGHYLQICPDGTGRTMQWWTPPDPRISLASGAEVLREALAAAVDARTSRGGIMSADLSGGMDSTTLCFLAARSAGRLTTVHYEALDPSNDDRAWADQCKAELPTVQHVVVPRGTAPKWYAGLAVAEADVEGPLPFVRSRAQTEHLAQLVSGFGSTRHLQGIGGDELFHPSLMCLHALVRQNAFKAVRHVRATKALRRWTLVSTLRTLLSSASYPRWLASSAQRLTTARAWGTEVDWEIAPKMPSWATSDAVGTARRLLLETAEDCQPLSPLPVQHEMIRLTQINGWAMRRNSRITSQFGVSLQAPFLDDRVLEAALSIRLEDRMAVGRFKPVLAATMRGIAPDSLLGRKTKGDASAELYAGMRQHRRELLELWDNSLLVQMGLVDADALRTLFRDLHPTTRSLVPLDATLACEGWLRSLPTSG